MSMLFVDNEGVTDPRVNLALEEHLLRHKDPEQSFVLLYINEPSVIVGRHQNVFEELNYAYVRTHAIPVVRRLSGGGTVYHDWGNLNFSFITPRDGGGLSDVGHFTDPIIHALRRLGVEVESNDRHDIVVHTYKVSGTAQYKTSRRVLSHGTLLFDADLNQVKTALDVKVSSSSVANEIVSRSVKSVRSRVANIRDFLVADSDCSCLIDIQGFRRRLRQEIFNCVAPDHTCLKIPFYRLTASDWDAVHDIVNQRYSQWDWNFGKSPEFEVCKSYTVSAGVVALSVTVTRGKIRTCRLRADFISQAQIAELEASLVGKRYTPFLLAASRAHLPPPGGD